MSLVGFRSSNHPQQVIKRGATNRDDLGTDPALFDRLNARFGFTLDVCATAANAKCADYFSLERGQDGLEKDWSGRVWCNPPYSQLAKWTAKAWHEERLMHVDLIVMLVPANRTEQVWWHDYIESYRGGPSLDVEFLQGRQRFVMPGKENIGPNERPPFGCCLLIWGLRRQRIVEQYGLHRRRVLGESVT